MIAFGTVFYVLNDGEFHIDGYTWLSMYVFFMVSQNVLYKRVLDTVPMSGKTVWKACLDDRNLQYVFLPILMIAPRDRCL